MLDIGLRPQISEPYNFKHLTHTKAHQFQNLDEANHGKLASEFFAIRASQCPQQELQGIKAESLQTRNRSSGLILEEPLPSENNLLKATPPKRPRRPQPHQLYISSASGGSPLSPRSMESFSQPSPRSYVSTPTPITPPPRVSSRRSTTDILLGHHVASVSPSPYPVAVEMLNGASCGDMTASPVAYMTAGWDNDQFDYINAPHAVTTPDETALTVKPLLFGQGRTELPNVPEEDEAALGRKDFPDEATELTTELATTKSFSSLKSCSVRWSSSSSRESAASPVSPLSEDCSSNELAVPPVGQSFDDHVPICRRLSCRLSIALNDIDRCWEDDIDYCYEHAAEADCDFDWDRSSMDEGKSSLADALDGLNLDSVRQGSRYSKMLLSDMRAPCSVPIPSSISLFDIRLLDMSVPGLDPSSRNSTKSSTVSIGCPITPSYSISSTPYNTLPLDPSKVDEVAPASEASSNHASLESRLVVGAVRQKLHAVDQTPGSHEVGSSESSSLQCDLRETTLIPIVKSNSQDSFFHSRPLSSIGRYRDSIAATSLPNLFTSLDQLRQKDLASQVATDLSAPSTAERILSVPARSPLRPRRSQILQKGISRPVVAEDTTGLNAVSSPHEKPLPLPPLQSQPDKPLPLPPCGVHLNELPLLGVESRSHGDSVSPPPVAGASGRFLSDLHHLPLASGSAIEAAPFGFFPSVPLPLS